MVKADIDAVPGFAGSPFPSGRGPEGIAFRKTEGQERGAAEIHAAGVDISLSHLDLTAGVTDSEPTVFVKGSRGGGLSGDHGGQG